jgi:hypothetical protein
VVEHYRDQGVEAPLVPPKYLDKMVLLNIPMDAETPQGRLLRPQALVQEYCLRKYVPVLAYRMDLASARSTDPQARDRERRRFEAVARCLPSGRLQGQAVEKPVVQRALLTLAQGA